MYQKAIRLLGATFLVYALLVATHLGEFWPFSIYPMFSQAGNPWSRAIVLDVTEFGGLPGWEPVSVSELPGGPVPLSEYGINRLDLSNLISKTEVWSEDRSRGLRSLLSRGLEGRRLLVLRVTGELNEQDSVSVRFFPYVVLEPDTTLLNPTLPR